jgi:two-component system chemotaxis response regulator CheY
MKALIIDDSRAMRRILNQIVSGLGFEVLEAGNGQEGLDVLSAFEDIELVLVDWNMPEMNGLEFVEAVRAKPTYQRLSLVMVTTESEPARMARALMAGVDEFVMKPFTPDILLEKLQLIGVKACVAG